MRDELQDFRRKLSDAGRVTYAARTGRHDDLVLAVAIAAWCIRPAPPRRFLDSIRAWALHFFDQQWSYPWQCCDEPCRIYLIEYLVFEFRFWHLAALAALQRYGRYWHLADNSAAPAFVRYWSNSGH
jgi:hypothetical protein